MSYKPKFCCQCGEKIERVNWRLWTSRRFCELCETEYGVHDKMPMLIALGGIFIGLFGVSSYLRTASPTVQPREIISRNTQSVGKVEQNQSNLNSVNANTRIEPQKNKIIVQNTPPQKLTTHTSETASNSTQEVSYFCGAATKKGNPCSRRVKGGGRCWQHEGQTAILPQEKLIAGNN